MSSLEEYKAAQAREYGTYVADGPIAVNGVRAFNDGDPVPVSHVTRGVVSRDFVKLAPGATEPGSTPKTPAKKAPAKKAVKAVQAPAAETPQES